MSSLVCLFVGSFAGHRLMEAMQVGQHGVFCKQGLRMHAIGDWWVLAGK